MFHRASGCEDPPVNHPGLLVQSLYNYVGDSEFPPVALDKWQEFHLSWASGQSLISGPESPKYIWNILAYAYCLVTASLSSSMMEHFLWSGGI